MLEAKKTGTTFNHWKNRALQCLAVYEGYEKASFAGDEIRASRLRQVSRLIGPWPQTVLDGAPEALASQVALTTTLIAARVKSRDDRGFDEAVQQLRSLLYRADSPMAAPPDERPATASDQEPQPFTHAQLTGRVRDLEAALSFYAKASHVALSDLGVWDRVSAEPCSFLCNQAGIASVEDGTLAALALRGDLTAQRLGGHASQEAL